jgi:MoaA/NifB/PqqE/SkfB family radical SAM enzyme
MSSQDKSRCFGHIATPLKRIHIELTNVCDFNCVFCPKDEMKRPYGYMDRDLAKSIIDTVREHGISDKITFHIMGEPTLHPHFFEILDYAQENHVRVGLTTNGAGLGGEVGRRLSTYCLHQVDVSLQTPDAESFSARRASVSFEDYVRDIMGFLRAYAIRDKETIFKFRFLNTRFCGSEMREKLNSLSMNASDSELRRTFRFWADNLYDLLEVDDRKREAALTRIGKLVSYKWNVVEIFDNLYFETYMLRKWSDATGSRGIRDAWSGYCYGMRDHFGILYNGDVVLCCIDFNGHTAIGNLHSSTLLEILSSSELKAIMSGFEKYRLVHPYCKKCLGSDTLSGWLFKPLGYVLSNKVLKNYFYKQSSIWG